MYAKLIYRVKIIVGLGNPGGKYKQTRHNVGFLALDFYLHDKNPIACQSKFAAEVCELHFGSTKVYFVKPTTFMNLSGTAVRDIVNFYKADLSKEVLVIHDEKDLPFGELRATHSSSSARHNGVQNIIDELGTQDFHRLRIGIESREPDSPLPTDAFVLEKFTKEEISQIEQKILPEVSGHIDQFIQS
jgi:PTH1 family peptidyl-tRNA hydrolase